MKTKILFLFALSLGILGCAKGEGDISVVEFQKLNSIKPLLSQVKSIDMVQLEADSNHLIGSIVELHLLGDSYIIVDKANRKIFRYGANGEFMNTIGRSGNGPGEYVDVSSVQCRDGMVNVFAWPSMLLRYSDDGVLQETREFQDLGQQSIELADGVLTYYGYGSGRGHRLGFEKDGELKMLVPSEEKVINMTARFPIFCENNGSVVFTDSYSDVLKKYADGKVTDYIKFDFKGDAIPEDFFQHEDPFDAVMSLMSKPYALIDFYQEDGEDKLVDVKIQNPSAETTEHVGLFRNNEWIWFSTGKAGKTALFASILLLKDDTLYCVLDPYMMESFPSELARLVSNPEVLNSISDNDNLIIAKIHLK